MLCPSRKLQLLMHFMLCTLTISKSEIRLVSPFRTVFFFFGPNTTSPRPSYTTLCHEPRPPKHICALEIISVEGDADPEYILVLCDAGGGTVDLISYTVSSLTPILTVNEAAPGDGALCGSSFLNRIFERHLIERCGSNPGWDEEVLEEVNLHLNVPTIGSS